METAKLDRLAMPAPGRFGSVIVAAGLIAGNVVAQVPPTSAEQARYAGLFAAAVRGDPTEIRTLVAKGDQADQRDTYRRTPLHVAAYRSNIAAMRALVEAGADPNALENDRYDIVTIAAVANDMPVLKTALALGCKATNVTSRYDGTALIAAAHLGHAEVVRELVKAGAPRDHINNLGWTALIEAIVLGDGGPRHVATLQVLVDAGASLALADRSGRSPLALARSRAYVPMIRILEAAGAR